MKPGLLFPILTVLPLLAGAAQAQDPAAGEDDFKRCRSCHAIVDDDGNAIMKGGKTGPNLYGVIGRTVGTADGFKFGDGLVAAGEAGIVWDEENLAAYITDPNGWLAEVLGDSSAKSKMTYNHRKCAEDMAAYLALHGSS